MKLKYGSLVTGVRKGTVRGCRFLEIPFLAQPQSVNKPSELLIDPTTSQQDKVMLELCDDVDYHLTN